MQVLFNNVFLKQSTRQSRFGFAQINMPNKVGVLGYGAIGKAFIEILLKNYPTTQIVAVDYVENPKIDNRFKYLQRRVTRDNVQDTLNYMGLQKGDFLVDLSTNVSFLDLWPLCYNNGVRYMNTALEQWEDSVDAVSYPKDKDELYRSSLGYIRDRAEKLDFWSTREGPTTVLEFGMNPGVISHCVKKGLIDAAAYFVNDETAKDIDRVDLKKRLEEKNYSKIAQILGVHTIHCSEWDNQSLPKKPKDIKTKLYNTWSCQGFLTEGLVPIQVARGSHEDMTFKDFEVVRDGKTIMSWGPSTKTWANSWVPNQNVKGVLIPHGEAYSINDFLHDPETGYSPSQYYVYDYNPYAKEFMFNQPADATIDTLHPPMEVIHPMNHPGIRGVDKVGAMLCMKNNRGWWTGSIMDDVDCRDLFDWKFGPTVLQVASGVYGGFLWGCKHPNSGCKWPELLDTDFIFEKIAPYFGRIVSTHVDLTKTSIKDCHKLQSFLCDPPRL